MPTAVNSCVLCEGNRDGFREFAGVRGWHYVRCVNCGLVFLDPQPTDTELTHFYNHGYRYDFARYQESIPKQYVWLEMLEGAAGSPGRLLEIGCSYGCFLSAARDRGWSAEGIELNKEAANYARSTLKLSVTQGRVADLQGQSSARFDAVAAWHVLEHDPCPGTLVEDAYSLLRPGGILALRVPNLDSTVARLAGSCWQWLSPPEHVCMYTRSTLSRLLTKYKFEIVEWRTVRGNARNTWFEILRARTKLAINKGSILHGTAKTEFSFDAPPMFQDRLWYRAAERVISIGAVPLDLLFNENMRTQGREAELAVVARKPVLDLIGERSGATEFEVPAR